MQYPILAPDSTILKWEIVMVKETIAEEKDLG